MIRVTKGPKPGTLQANAEAWTAELLDRLAQGPAPTAAMLNRYRQDDVKAQVRADSHDKCIYCESRISHVYFGDIEHLRPKGPFPGLRYEWTNLGYVCAQCNNAKGNKFDEAVPPINPFVEDPAEFVVAHGDMIWPRPGADRGGETIGLVRLNRPALLERRRAKAEEIRRLVEVLNRTPGQAAKEALQETLEEALRDDQEFAMCARAAAAVLRQAAEGGPI